MIEIAWIFPRHLNTYGDAGNIAALRYRCDARGLAHRVHRVEPGDPFPAATLVFIGGGQDRCQAAAAGALLALREPLRAAIVAGCVVLGVCAGYQFLGHHYELPDGTRVPGLGCLDVTTTAGPDRLVGKVAVAPHPDLHLGAPLVGFENHSGRTVLGAGPDLRPLGRVVRGHGNNGRDGLEGAFQGTVFGSYLHGPLLPNNPQFCDLLLRLARRRDGRDDPLPPLDDAVETRAAAAYLEQAP